MLRIVIGLQNYNGVACGVNFEKSVGQGIPEDWTVEHVQVKRLMSLFPGTTVEDVGVGKAVEPKVAEKPKPKPEPVLKEEAEEAPEPAPEPETEPTVPPPAEEAEEAPQAEPVEEEENEEVAEEVEEVEEPAEEPLKAGDDVLAHYKGEFRKGKVVKILDSGVVRVKIDGDDANYRVLDDDKVAKLDPEAAE